MSHLDGWNFQSLHLEKSNLSCVKKKEQLVLWTQWVCCGLIHMFALIQNNPKTCMWFMIQLVLSNKWEITTCYLKLIEFIFVYSWPGQVNFTPGSLKRTVSVPSQSPSSWLTGEMSFQRPFRQPLPSLWRAVASWLVLVSPACATIQVKLRNFTERVE